MGRTYRSKKQRQCDLCRSRKTHCKMHGSESACELCNKLERRCTFVLGPLRRVYRPQATTVASDYTASALMAQDDQNELMFGSTEESSWLPPADQDESALLSMDWSTMAPPPPGFSISPEPSGSSADDGEAPAPNECNHQLQPHHVDTELFDVQHQTGGTSSWRANNVSRAESGASVRDPDVVVDVRLVVPATESMSVSHLHQPTDGTDRAGARSRVLQKSDWPVEFSLDSRKGYSNQVVGLSCESDPFLLRHYHYNLYDTYPMCRLDFRRVVDEVEAQPPNGNASSIQSQPNPTYPPVQFVMTHEYIWQNSINRVEGLLSGSNTEEGDLHIVNKLVPAKLGLRLLRLYARFIHPRFPVLSLADLAHMPYSECNLVKPIGLQSAVYALAAPFTFLDDELSVSEGYAGVPAEELWGIAQRSFLRATCLSHLSSLQLCLLLLQMPPPNFAVAEPLSTWSLSCSALAMAESLGLNLDPLDWKLPRKEIMLRRRLWWSTYTQHTWQAIAIGQPSHINDANWDVSKLDASDFEQDEVADPEIKTALVRQIPICLAHCELSIIAADVMRELYTLKAVRESHSLSALLNRAQPLRARIEGWRQTLPFLSKLAADLNEDELEDGAALRLSHLTLEILIFRALLRPLACHASPGSENPPEPIPTIFENCYTCARVGIGIVSALKAKDFAIFWSPYVRYQLCYFSTFMLINLAQSPNRESAEETKPCCASGEIHFERSQERGLSQGLPRFD